MAIVLQLTDWEGLKARKKIAQGKAILRATPWVNVAFDDEVGVSGRAKTQTVTIPRVMRQRG